MRETKRRGAAAAGEGARPQPAQATPAELRAELARLGAPRLRVHAAEVEPMLAEIRPRPFSAPGWLYELKYDGFRCIAAREGGGALLVSRNGKDLSHPFPELVQALAALPFEHVVLDGELVVLDGKGKPSFQRLQRRALRSGTVGSQLLAEHPASLFVFDLLGFEDFDARPLPLVARKALLRRVLPASGPLRYVDHLDERGAELFEQVRALGLEGVMAKKASAPYRAGRSADWLKVRTEKSADFVVVGYAGLVAGGVGALHLGAYEGGALVYAGKVGSGFTDALRVELRRTLDPSRRATPPCEGTPKGPQHHWTEPELVVEVRYLTWLQGGHVRHPVFLRLRDDKRPEECVREQAAPELPDAPVAPPPPAKSDSARQVTLTHLDKVFWPGDGYTKGELIAFYREASPWILPYLRDRPLVMARYPDGIEGKSFFQKDAPASTPPWVRTARLASAEEGGRAIDYILCDDEETLLYVANLGAIPLHVWASRARDLHHPDWCILDLDPKEAPFGHVLTLARAIRGLCEELELPCYPKTSGQKGMHVLLPLGGQCTHEEAKALGELLARLIEAEHPELGTTERSIAKRGGRVYLDALQNGQGKTLVAPFSVRPQPGAPVSTPLRWSEVNARLDPRAFTIKTLPTRMRRLKEDPLRPVLEEKPDLQRALARLAERLRGDKG